jgi:ATP-binding cassette subfamily C (CFTR/MRP) protein 2
MRMNGTTKSLIANHLAESAAGAITIRAFKKEDRFFTKNLDLIDTNASPFFHSFSANEWLIQWIELVSSTVLASAALCMVLLPPRTFSSGQYTLVILRSMTIADLVIYKYFMPFFFLEIKFIE